MGRVGSGKGSRRHSTAAILGPIFATRYKQSGFGRETALETLDMYLESKGVIVNTGAKPVNPLGL